MLLEQKRENELSRVYENESHEVMTRHGDQVVLRSSRGVQYKRNLHYIKPVKVPTGNIRHRRKILN